MEIKTRFSLGDRVVARLFPGKFEWCTIKVVYVTDDPKANILYQMENGLLIKEKYLFSTREESIEWAERTPYDES